MHEQHLIPALQESRICNIITISTWLAWLIRRTTFPSVCFCELFKLLRNCSRLCEEGWGGKAPGSNENYLNQCHKDMAVCHSKFPMKKLFFFFRLSYTFKYAIIFLDFPMLIAMSIFQITCCKPTLWNERINCETRIKLFGNI